MPNHVDGEVMDTLSGSASGHEAKLLGFVDDIVRTCLSPLSTDSET